MEHIEISLLSLSSTTQLSPHLESKSIKSEPGIEKHFLVSKRSLHIPKWGAHRHMQSFGEPHSTRTCLNCLAACPHLMRSSWSSLKELLKGSQGPPGLLGAHLRYAGHREILDSEKPRLREMELEVSIVLWLIVKL